MKRYYKVLSASSAASFLGLFTVAVASFFLMGYVCDKPSYYTWPHGSTPVALPTSLVFIALGSAIYMLSAIKEDKVEGRLESDEDRLARIERAISTLPQASKSQKS